MIYREFKKRNLTNTIISLLSRENVYHDIYQKSEILAPFIGQSVPVSNETYHFVFIPNGVGDELKLFLLAKAWYRVARP